MCLESPGFHLQARHCLREYNAVRVCVRVRPRFNFWSEIIFFLNLTIQLHRTVLFLL